MVDPVSPRINPYGIGTSFFYSTAVGAAARACSESTVRSIVKPQHVILLHLLLKTHNKHPLQDALINPKNVSMNVEFSLTKVLKSHIVILYLHI